MIPTRILMTVLGGCLVAVGAHAQTYGEMAMRNAQMRAAEQNRGATVIVMQPPAAGVPSGPVYYQPPAMTYQPSYSGYAPQPTGSSLYMLPGGPVGTPDPRMVRWTYGQVNASSDPYNTWALSSPGLYVPWSTPMSSWANSQSWNWWRERAGDAGPPPPLW